MENLHDNKMGDHYLLVHYGDWMHNNKGNNGNNNRNNRHFNKNNNKNNTNGNTNNLSNSWNINTNNSTTTNIENLSEDTTLDLNAPVQEIIAQQTNTSSNNNSYSSGWDDAPTIVNVTDEFPNSWETPQETNAQPKVQDQPQTQTQINQPPPLSKIIAKIEKEEDKKRKPIFIKNEQGEDYYAAKRKKRFENIT